MNDLRVESVIPKRMFLVPLTCLSSGRLPRVSEYNTDDYSFNGTMQLLLNKDFSLIKVKKGQVLDIIPSMLLISYKERYNTEYIFFNFSRLSNTCSFCSMKFRR